MTPEILGGLVRLERMCVLVADVESVDELEQLEQVLRDRRDELARERDAERFGDELERRKLVEERRTASGCYRLEFVRCGKRRCKCAAVHGRGGRVIEGGELHGPYWYAYVYSARKGGHVHRYVGKPGSPNARAAGLP